MRHVEVNTAHLMVHLPDHRHLVRRLQEEGGLRGIEQIGRDAGRPATRLARIHRLAAQDLVVRSLQLVFRKLRQIGIVGVRHPKRRLLSGVVRHVGMRRVVSDRRRAAGHRDPIGADRDPAGIVRGEVGDFHRALCARGRERESRRGRARHTRRPHGGTAPQQRRIWAFRSPDPIRLLFAESDSAPTGSHDLCRRAVGLVSEGFGILSRRQNGVQRSMRAAIWLRSAPPRSRRSAST